MVQKELSLFKNTLCYYFFLFLVCIGCTDTNQKENLEAVFGTINITQIPKDTIALSAQKLKLNNGIYYFDGKPFSGFIKETYENDTLKSIGSYFEGKQHGPTTTFYSNGQLRDKRMYKENTSYGRHFGFWENGNKKFDFVYYNDKREGLQKQWYRNGSQYAFLNFKNDVETGMQQAWRENGKPYINYEVKDGIRYGLQKAALCYTLKDEELKMRN